MSSLTQSSGKGEADDPILRRKDRQHVDGLPQLAEAAHSFVGNSLGLWHWGGAREDVPVTASVVRQWLEEGQPRLPGFGMVRGGIEVPLSEITRTSMIRGSRVRGIPCVDGIAKRLRQGYTLVFTSMEAWSPAYAEFLDRVGAAFGATPSNSTCILSPPSQNAFDLHQDDEHVLVFHLDGTKRWVFDDVEVVLSPGDVMYVPPSKPHQVFSTDVGSLSVAIGLNYEFLPVAVARAFRQLITDEVEDVDQWSDRHLVDAVERVAELGARISDSQPAMEQPSAPPLRRMESIEELSGLPSRS